jgi:hypothetical protein
MTTLLPPPLPQPVVFFVDSFQRQVMGHSTFLGGGITKKKNAEKEHTRALKKDWFINPKQHSRKQIQRTKCPKKKKD